ncbi:hypothetical protein ACE3NQ_18925 [Paenibacillus terreus]|uniref:Uncharacterized protein n=1 Tax=Paenibacillus terreus TaxID=1387834 RepID=A0ABV5BBB1_9BACL
MDGQYVLQSGNDPGCARSLFVYSRFPREPAFSFAAKCTSYRRYPQGQGSVLVRILQPADSIIFSPV